MSEQAQNDGRNLLTHSRMACAKTCLRRHWYLYELGIRRDRDSDPLRIGLAVHFGLDRLAQGIDPAAEIDAMYATPPAWCKEPEALEKWEIEAVIARELLAGYARHWAGQPPLEIVASELSWGMPLRNPETGGITQTWKLAGKLDMLARLPDGRLALVEHKTAGEDIGPASDYWARLRIDQQISLYVLAARKLGHDVQTVLYNVVRKPLIRPRKLTKAESAANGGLEREDMTLYAARLAADLDERPEMYFARQEIPRLDQDLLEFEYELWQMQGLLRDCQRLGRWPRNTSACLHPYKCPVWELCIQGWDTSTGEIPGGFRQLANVHPELEERDRT